MSIHFRKRSEAGFSLIELLIVVGIILVIAAIAIPNFIRARISANEASAVSSVHAVSTAQIGYASAYPQIGYSGSLADLGPGSGGACTPTAACFIDPALATGNKSGYKFTYGAKGATPSFGFTLNADPQFYGLTGQTSYFTDETNVIHYNPTGPASATDPSL
jgi:type IV pilus assembly protein PilA